MVEEPAVEMLASFKPHPPAALPLLVNCLSHTNPSVRLRAAVALGHFGSNGVVALPELERATADPDPEVHEAAQTTLREIRYLSGSRVR